VTSTVTKLTARVIESGPHAGVGVVAVVLLIALLIEFEVLRTVGGTHWLERRPVFQVAIAPLLVAFVAVIVSRLAESLHSP
jgi:hypothetical protein